MASSLDVLLFVSSILGRLQLGLEKLSAGDFVSLGSQGLPQALDPPTADCRIRLPFSALDLVSPGLSFLMLSYFKQMCLGVTLSLQLSRYLIQVQDPNINPGSTTPTLWPHSWHCSLLAFFGRW